MAKIKVTTAVVNRGGKRYISENGIIEVLEQDLSHFDWFAKVEDKKPAPKKVTPKK